MWFEADLVPGYVWSFPLPDGRANVGFGIQRGGKVATKEMKALWPEILARPHIAAVLGPDAQPEARHQAWPIPARVDGRHGELVVPDEKLSLAIGRKGQNVRLAAQALGTDNFKFWRNFSRYRQYITTAMEALGEEAINRLGITMEQASVPGFNLLKALGFTNEQIEEANEALSGLSVGVQRATIHENFLRDNFPDLDISVYASQDEANLDLVNGRVDLVMADSVVLLEGFLQQEEGAGYHFVGPDYFEEEWHGEGIGIAVRKGEDDLREAFNDAIEQIREEGTYQEINEKYFDFDVYGE